MIQLSRVHSGTIDSSSGICCDHDSNYYHFQLSSHDWGRNVSGNIKTMFHDSPSTHSTNLFCMNKLSALGWCCTGYTRANKSVHLVVYSLTVQITSQPRLAGASYRKVSWHHGILLRIFFLFDSYSVLMIIKITMMMMMMMIMIKNGKQSAKKVVTLCASLQLCLAEAATIICRASWIIAQRRSRDNCVVFRCTSNKWAYSSLEVGGLAAWRSARSVVELRPVSWPPDQHRNKFTNLPMRQSTTFADHFDASRSDSARSEV